MLNRSEELQSLSKNEVEDEKLALQKALLYFENIHGRPVTKDEKGECLDVSFWKSWARIASRSALLGSAPVGDDDLWYHHHPLPPGHPAGSEALWLQG